MAAENRCFQGRGGRHLGSRNVGCRAFRAGAIASATGGRAAVPSAAHRVGLLYIRAWVQGLCGGFYPLVSCACSCA